MFGWLKRFIPASRRYVQWRFEESEKEQKKALDTSERIEDEVRQLKMQIAHLEELLVSIRQESDSHTKYLLKRMHETKSDYKKDLEFFNGKLNEIKKSQYEIKNEIVSEVKQSKLNLQQNEKKNIGISKEILWAETFHDAIRDTTWLTNQAFVPGRWAAGYPFLYVLYRILNEVHPTSILEMGLGQTTRMISQYASSDETVEHFVTEHDDAWIAFFEESYNIPANTKILKQQLANVEYKQDDNVLVYDDFSAQIQGKQFGLICIDAPFGGQAQVFSRIDVLKCMPTCLADSFIIIMDDYNRPGEQNTVKEMFAVLDESNIAYKHKVYEGEKHTCVITSEDLSFLCSL